MDVTYISCGEFHAAVVLDSGEVFTWGRSGSRLGYICEEGRQTLTVLTNTKVYIREYRKLMRLGLRNL